MFALMNWELYRSIKGMSNKNKHQSVLFTRMWEFGGGCMTGAGGETRTPNIQIRSLSEWVNWDILQQTRIIISVR